MRCGAAAGEVYEVLGRGYGGWGDALDFCAEVEEEGGFFVGLVGGHYAAVVGG